MAILSSGLDHFIKSLHAWRWRSGQDYGPLALAYSGVMGYRATRCERATTPRDGMIAIREAKGGLQGGSVEKEPAIAGLSDTTYTIDLLLTVQTAQISKSCDSQSRLQAISDQLPRISSPTPQHRAESNDNVKSHEALQHHNQQYWAATGSPEVRGEVLWLTARLCMKLPR